MPRIRMPSIRLMRLRQSPPSGRKSPVCDLNRGRRGCRCSLPPSLSLSLSLSLETESHSEVLWLSSLRERNDEDLWRLVKFQLSESQSVPEMDPGRSSRLARQRGLSRRVSETEFDEFLKKKRDPHRAPPAIAHPHGGGREEEDAVERFSRDNASPRLASPRPSPALALRLSPYPRAALYPSGFA